MASIQAGLTNPLGSPRTFGNPSVSRNDRMTNVFQAGAPIQVAAAASARAPAPSGSVAFSKVPRDPRSPQTRSALWEPLHDWTKVDDADTFSCLAGGEAGSVSLAGHGRIKKKSNLTEIDFYTKLSEPDMNSSLAPQFCGSHMSDGTDWTHFVVLEDLTLPFSKPAVLDVQIGREHEGSGDAGTADPIGLRINGMRQPLSDGVLHRDKEWGGTVEVPNFCLKLEEFLTDAKKQLRAEVAGAAVGFLEKLEGWVAAQLGLRLVGSSVLIVYEGDTTVVDPPEPVVKIIDFMHVRVEPEDSPDESYLNGIRNLRWMLERLVMFCEIELAEQDSDTGRDELKAAREALKAASSKCSTAKSKCIALSPEKGAHTSGVLHEDILKESVATAVQGEEDNVIAGFLKAVLAKHKINPGEELFMELLQWRVQSLILDRVFLTDLCDKYGVNSAAVDDLLKWKETSDTRLREMSYIYDVKLSGNSSLPSYYDLLVTQDEVQARLMQ